MCAPPTTMLKLSMLHYRDQSHDEATWMKWWKEEHMPSIMPIALKHGIERVELYLTQSSFKKQLQADLEKHKSGSTAGWKMDSYHAVSIYWTTDFQNVRDMLTDPDWDVKVTKPAEGWVDTKKADVQVGTQTTFIENGKIVKNTTNDFNTGTSLLREECGLDTSVVGYDMAGDGS